MVPPVRGCGGYIGDGASRYNRPTPLAWRLVPRIAAGRGGDATAISRRSLQARRLGRVCRLLGDPDHRRTQQPVMDEIAGLQHLDDRAGGFLGALDFVDRLVKIMVEKLA